MKLRATVKIVTGGTVHFVARRDGPMVCGEPSYVTIHEQDGAFYLLRYGPDDEFVADTWHTTIDEAKSQAEFEYGIGGSDWIDCSDSD